jgi:hypothetical protein
VASDRIDLTGKQFNEWTVLSYYKDDYWTCKCSCGVIKNVRQYALTTKNKDYMSVSCGHTRADKLSKHDLVGNTFKDITVLESVGRGRYKCLCKCGKYKVMAGGDIRKGKGIVCKHKLDEERQKLIGKKFNELTILGINGAKAECQCSCGNIIEQYISSIESNRVKSCGCLRERNRDDLTGKTLGYLYVNKWLGNNTYECICECGNTINVTGSNLRQISEHSCGCKTRTMYRVRKDEALNRMRTKEQIEALDSRENIIKFINKHSNSDTITSYELQKILGISRSNMHRYIDMYNLDDIVCDNAFCSKIEIDIGEYIESLGTKIIKHYKKINNCSEVDIYIPEKKIALEINGSYWHSTLFKDKYYHQQKTIACARQGIRLIHIFDYEWANDEIRQNIEDYIYGLLTESKTVIQNENIIVKNIDATEAENFIRNYYIKQYEKSKIHLGCYCQDELIGVMTLDKTEINNKCKYTINQLCIKPNIDKMNCIEKMIKSFKEMYQPTYICISLDISKFTGNTYIHLGFEPVQPNPITEPSYKLVNYNTLETISFEDKVNNIDESRYLKVYDSGNIELEWHKEV